MYRSHFTAVMVLAGAAVFALAAATQIEKPRTSPQQTASIKAFGDKVKNYVDLRKMLEGQLPGLKSTRDAAEIAAHRNALAARLVDSRRGAVPGDIFTPDISAQFRAVIQETFREPGSHIVRRTIREGDPPKPIAVKVNTVYPDDSPVVTTPPTLLMRLPELPADLTYRILGRNFILLDSKTNLIVDFIPDVVP